MSGGLRIASWNLGGAKRPREQSISRRDGTTAELGGARRSGSDVVLVQEAVFAAVELPDGWRQSREGAPHGWGSIIAVSPDVEFDAKWRTPSPVLAAYGSYLAFGRFRRSQSDWINVVSVHTPRTGWAGKWPTVRVHGLKVQSVLGRRI